MRPQIYCYYHLDYLITGEWCERCLVDFENRPDAEAMTGDQRAREIERWFAPLMIPFENIHKRFDELIGRPLFTHQLIMKEELIEEARTRSGKNFNSPISDLMKLRGGSEGIIVVEP